MCGGGGYEPYSAYKSGDFDAWKRQFDRIAEIELAAARGEIPQDQAKAQIDAIRTGIAAATPAPTPAPAPTTTARARPSILRGGEDSGGFAPGFRDNSITGARYVGGEDSGGRTVGSRSKTASSSLGGGSQPLSKLENKLKEDPSAAMEMRELMRQHNINLGKISIDQAFSKFGDDYYKKYRDDYTGYYFPQLDEQYGKVTDKMTAILADRGILSSSIGSNKFADLAKEHSNARTNISNEALDAANKLRGQVESAKSNLYSLNEASADPQAINAQAIGQATALVAPPTYSPLGNIFAGAFDAFNNYMSARQNRPYYQSGYTSPYPTGYGSGRVVR